MVQKRVLAMSDDGLSDEDRALFREMVRCVKPLQTKKIIVRHKTITPKVIHPPLPPLKSRHQPCADPYLSDYYCNPVEAESRLAYCCTGFPAARMRELKQGQIYWQGRLDLHGLKAQAAKDTLLRFIFQETERAHRCVLIIHGKGGQRGETPVLKNLVNHWLPQIPQVLAFHSAIAKDGGNGAIYVLLKRQREENARID